MADTINIDKNNATWITVKDASDLLGVSETHTWRLAKKNDWQTRKQLSDDRKKSYFLLKDIEQYHKGEQERQRLAKLPLSNISDKSNISNKSDIKHNSDLSNIENDPMSNIDKAMSDINRPMSDIKNLPILLSDYRKMVMDFQKRQEEMTKAVERWRTTTYWLIVVMLLCVSGLGYYLYDTKKAMSDIKTEMSNKVNSMSDRINTMSDKVIEAQAELLKAKDELSKRATPQEQATQQGTPTL